MNKPESVDVSFIPDQDVLDVFPPIRAGVRDSSYIRFPAGTKAEIIKQMENKLMLAYGITAHDYTVYSR